MFTRFKVGALLLFITISLCAVATPAAPVKKASPKHKIIPARHNAGRPIHP